jgi:hypothetical protein
VLDEKREKRAENRAKKAAEARKRWKMPKRKPSTMAASSRSRKKKKIRRNSCCRSCEARSFVTAPFLLLDVLQS